MKKMITSLKLIFQEAYKKDMENLPKALQTLRENNASQMESVKIVRSALEISLKEADDIVRNSEVWADKKETIDKLRKAFWDALEDLE